AAGHPEMHEQRPGIRAEQQVLRAARDRVDALTGEDGGQLRRNRPAQARLADLERLDAAADDERRKTAAGRFDFGELRHRMAQLTLPRRRSLPSPGARRSWSQRVDQRQPVRLEAQRSSARCDLPPWRRVRRSDIVADRFPPLERHTWIPYSISCSSTTEAC